MFQPLKYRRVLLKLSGEILAAGSGFGVDQDFMSRLVKEIYDVHELGVELGIVIGGGNFFRGVQAGSKGLDRAAGDYMGMLGTAINALAASIRVCSRLLRCVKLRSPTFVAALPVIWKKIAS
jgi:uridylate kinase